MRKPVSGFVAWLIWALAMALCVAVIGLSLAYPASLEGPDRPSAIVQVLFYLPALLAYPTVGALVAARRPAHPVGWLFLAMGTGINGGFAGFGFGEWLTANASTPPPLPGLLAVWLSSLTFVAGVGCALAALLLFPDGRLLSPRWRPALWLVILGFAVNGLGSALKPGPPGGVLENPFGVPALEPVLEPAIAASEVLIPAGFLATAIAVVVRLRRSRGVERQQMKWLTYAAMLMGVSFGAIPALPTEALVNTSWGFGFLGLGLVPVAAGIAILRYRLWDIDLLIRRTLTYGALTAALALVYFGSITLLQSLFAAVTGQRSAVAIVISTLAIAALFTPLRRRVQDFIDRRFYRRKYDAARVLAEFGASARDEVELEKLAGRLVQVVEETMQPERVSLWLKPTAGSRPLTADSRPPQSAVSGPPSAVTTLSAPGQTE